MINNDKQRIIDLFNDCNIEIYPDEQKINYYKNNVRIGTYHLKSEHFTYGLFSFSKFLNTVRDSGLTINELFNPIVEEIIKRKISIIKNW